MYNLWKSHLKRGLREDGWPWDWTTLSAIQDREKTVDATIHAKSSGIWAGHSLTVAVHSLAQELLRPGLTFSAISEAEDGSSIEASQVVSRWRGPCDLILALERSYLNLASFVSGIATRTHQFVDLLNSHHRKNTRKKTGWPNPKDVPKIVMTRKTLPGYRDLSAFGVLVGGGRCHRWNLSGGILIKENHITCAGGIPQSLARAFEKAPHPLKVEIEVKDLKELREALRCGAQLLLLDNFSSGAVKKAVELIKNMKTKPIVEVSGGINESNVRKYAVPGVNFISIGCLTHSVKSIDLSLTIDRDNTLKRTR